jgi:hypothetical protein
MRKAGVSTQEAIRKLSRHYGLPRRRLYRLWLDLK